MQTENFKVKIIKRKKPKVKILKEKRTKKMKGFMYGVAAMFAVFALIVAVSGLSNITLCGMVAGAVVFGLIGKVTV